LRQAGAGRSEIRAADAKSVMAATQRVLDAIAAFAGAQRCASDLKKREVLIAALQQRLIAEMRHHSKTQHLSVESLGACEVGDLEPEMVETFEFHRRCSVRLHTVNESSRTRDGTARGVQPR
jgi:hypothetical protein